MDISELFHLFVRWTHLVSAAAWVGGNIFWVLVLNPSANSSKSVIAQKMQSQISTEFRGLVDTCIFVLLATGAIMTFNRLTPGEIGYQYVLVLGLKIILVAGMFYLIRSKRHSNLITFQLKNKSSYKSKLSKLGTLLTGYNLVLIIGLMVYLLSDLMNMIYAASLSN